MLANDLSDFIHVIKDLLSGIIEAFKFVITLPNIFISWLSGMPAYFQVGISVVTIGIIVCMFLKLKTFFTL